MLEDGDHGDNVILVIEAPPSLHGAKNDIIFVFKICCEVTRIHCTLLYKKSYVGVNEVIKLS